MGKIKTYNYSDFAKTQEGAVQCFLHHAYDHLLASQQLASQPRFLDSSAYLCNMAFELLLKAMYMAEDGKFNGIHNLIDLHNGLVKKIFSKKDGPLVNVIDKYNFVRYPVDKPLHKSQKQLRLGGRTFAVDEIGTDELEKASELFLKVWRKLSKNKKLKVAIKNISDNPYRKGNRVVMCKPK